MGTLSSTLLGRNLHSFESGCRRGMSACRDSRGGQPRSGKGGRCGTQLASGGSDRGAQVCMVVRGGWISSCGLPCSRQRYELCMGCTPSQFVIDSCHH